MTRASGLSSPFAEELFTKTTSIIRNAQRVYSYKNRKQNTTGSKLQYLFSGIYKLAVVAAVLVVLLIFASVSQYVFITGLLFFL